MTGICWCGFQWLFLKTLIGIYSAITDVNRTQSVNVAIDVWEPMLHCVSFPLPGASLGKELYTWTHQDDLIHTGLQSWDAFRYAALAAAYCCNVLNTRWEARRWECGWRTSTIQILSFQRDDASTWTWTVAAAFPLELTFELSEARRAHS